MPFVSIVQEKVDALQPFGEHLNFYVEEYAGFLRFLTYLKDVNKNNGQT